MKCFVITTNPYIKHGPFTDQVQATKYGESLNQPYKIVWRNF